MHQLLLFRELITIKSNKAAIVLILLLALSIPLPIRINSALIVVAFIYFTKMVLVNRDVKINQIKSPFSILCILSLFISVVGLIYTPDLKQGWLDLERGAFLLTITIISFEMKNLNLSLSKLITAFTFSTFVITLYGFIHSIAKSESYSSRGVFNLDRSYFIDSTLIHPVYLSVYFIFIFFFLIEFVRTKLKWDRSVIGLMLLLFLIVVILFSLRSQMSLIIFVMLVVIYSIIVFKRRAWLVTFVLFTIGLMVFLLDSNRVTTFFDTYGRNVSTALDQRYSVWRGAIEGIKMSPIFGAGTGGEQQLINNGYAKIGYQEGIDNSFNAHNQYLQFLARNGILELGCFLALLFYSFKKSLEMPNYTFLMFNMAITLIMFTESFLNVQKGIVFFYFFVCAFIFLPYESEPKSGKSILN